MFLRKHLEKINIKINSLEDDLFDGVYLILLMGILEDYYIPQYAYCVKPVTLEDKVSNCNFLFELIDDAGLPIPNCTPEDVANKDLKSILRILYTLFSNYKEKE
jgi:parvin